MNDAKIYFEVPGKFWRFPISKREKVIQNLKHLFKIRRAQNQLNQPKQIFKPKFFFYIKTIQGFEFILSIRKHLAEIQWHRCQQYCQLDSVQVIQEVGSKKFTHRIASQTWQMSFEAANIVSHVTWIGYGSVELMRNQRTFSASDIFIKFLIEFLDRLDDDPLRNRNNFESCSTCKSLKLSAKLDCSLFVAVYAYLNWISCFNNLLICHMKQLLGMGSNDHLTRVVARARNFRHSIAPALDSLWHFFCSAINCDEGHRDETSGWKTPIDFDFIPNYSITLLCVACILSIYFIHRCSNATKQIFG